MCLVNVEDSPDEMDLRIAAAMQLHGVAPREIAGRLKVLSGDIGLCLVRRERRGSGMEIVAPVIDMLVEALKQDGIDALCLDPLAMLHQGEENSNEDMLQVVAALRQIALRANVAVQAGSPLAKWVGNRPTAKACAARPHCSAARASGRCDQHNDRGRGGHARRARRRAGCGGIRVSNAKANYGARAGDELV